ncbi:MAG: hypothetical protein SVS15_09750 [Thermodesulfobacteriota bacterium]|nr:hypothetical protein [Thermodesulfobacteriota bacterium]
MTTVMPQGELLRKAVTWISEGIQETKKDTAVLIDEAAVRFNLSPKDSEFLTKFFKDNQDKQD